MRILVCGGRDYPYDDGGYLRWKLDIIAQNICSQGSANLFFIAGGARGVDHLAMCWAIDRGYNHKVYPADWKKHGKSAGYIRNKQMLVEGKPDLVVAFPGGKGTAMMIDLARKAGVEVIEVGTKGS